MFPVLDSFIQGRKTETGVSYGILDNATEISSLGLTVFKSISFKN